MIVISIFGKDPWKLKIWPWKSWMSLKFGIYQEVREAQKAKIRKWQDIRKLFIQNFHQAAWWLIYNSLEEKEQQEQEQTTVLEQECHSG